MSADPVEIENKPLSISLKQAASCILKIAKAKRVPMLHGSPGVGKSAIVAQIAKQYNLALLDERLAQKEPQDLVGFPSINQNSQKAGYIPFENFPVEGDSLPSNPATGKPYDGWLLFLDEINSADDSVQAAAYKIVLDRMVGNKKIHERVIVVAAGNLESDNAIVKPMSTALQSRMVHLRIEASFTEWLSWAMDLGFDYRITSYLQFRPEHLYRFSPDHNDLTYACHRTWEFAQNMLTVCGGNVTDADFLPMLAGCVTEGIAREFLGFCDVHQHLPKMSDIDRAPDLAMLPEEPGHLYALCGALGEHMDAVNADKVLEYMLRMPPEFQVVTMRYVMKKGKVPMNNPTVAKWLSQHAAKLF